MARGGIRVAVVRDDSPTYSIPCPCGKRAYVTAGVAIYPHAKNLHHKNFFLCSIDDGGCGRYVGCDYRGNPLGDPADALTRTARKDAHEIFDSLWSSRSDAFSEAARSRARTEEYAWMARLLGLEKKDAHIGRLSYEQCQVLIRACEARRGWLDD